MSPFIYAHDRWRREESVQPPVEEPNAKDGRNTKKSIAIQKQVEVESVAKILRGDSRELEKLRDSVT
ncbi:hypothetical protein MMC28_003923 [Mycoblastus sanguinarius]|nr:hypothetical protein [Mycoblastus sanguinarius]